jgi:hypothetical protein
MEAQFRNIDIKGPQRVKFQWRRETPRDETSDRPDERDDGFWPSLNPEEAGYIGDAEPSDVDGAAQQARYDSALAAAEKRMEAWENDEWEFVGVVAVAEVAIPIGGGSYALHTFRSPGVWGVESDAGDYLDTLYVEQKAELLAQLRTLGAALGQPADFDEEG